MSAWPIALTAAGTATAAAAWAAVYPTSQIFGNTLHHTSHATRIALTFDDGPNPAITPQLLTLLERHTARATFFVLGKYARSSPELVRDIAARGHTIGNHTETHPNLALLTSRRIEDELRRCQASIAAALPAGAAAPKWMRPPFGFRGPQLGTAVRRAQLSGVAMWSLTCYDWKPQPASKLIARLSHVRQTGANGPIVLLHDGDFQRPGADRHHVIAALEHWLPRWRDGGLEFVTIDDAAKAL